MFTFVLLIINSVLNAISVLTPSVVCFILWRIQTPNRPPTPYVLIDSEKICGMGEVYLTISRHKTRTDVRTKLNFPFCALEFMRNSDCGTENGFAVAVGRAVGKGERGRKACSFFLWFLSRYARKKSFLLSVEGFILIVYIIIIKLKILLDKK